MKGISLKSPCRFCSTQKNCTRFKCCSAWRLWFSNEWKRIRMMFTEEEDERGV